MRKARCTESLGITMSVTALSRGREVAVHAVCTTYRDLFYLLKVPVPTPIASRFALQGDGLPVLDIPAEFGTPYFYVAPEGQLTPSRDDCYYCSECEA